jgi:hypothetical protein
LSGQGPNSRLSSAGLCQVKRLSRNVAHRQVASVVLVIRDP